MEDFLENMVRNVIICMSSIMIKMNSDKNSLSQMDSKIPLQQVIYEDYKTVENILQSKGDIA